MAISILRAARWCCKGLLASPQGKQSCPCHPLGHVLSFPDPTKHGLELCWFLGSLLAGQVLLDTLKESSPQSWFLSRSLLSCPAAVPRPSSAVTRSVPLLLKRGLFVSVLLCLATGPKSFLPPHSCLELFKYLERVHFARAGILLQPPALLFVCSRLRS